jgi:phosphatidylinositol kinase/protein kinase (PI-3  family)
MFIAALSIRAKSSKQCRFPSAEDWIQKMCFLFTGEYYSALTKDTIMNSGVKWMELENIILTKVVHTQKDRHYMYLLISRYLP